jgi:hypothetical protein
METKMILYDRMDLLHRTQGERIFLHEHKTGFPSVMVDCEDVHILTDIRSLEQWAKSQGSPSIFDRWLALEEVKEPVAVG